MKISSEESAEGSFRLKAVADGRWDGSPLNSVFEICHVPIQLNPDRIAVAAALLFSDAFGGVVDYEEKINLVTAGAISSYCRPASIYPGPIDEGPKPIVDGKYDLFIRPVTAFQDIEIDDQFENRYLYLADSSTFSGQLSFHRGILASSNVWSFSHSALHLRIASYLAAGVLLAEDFDCKCLRFSLSGEMEKSLSLSWKEKVIYLLSSVGLTVKFDIFGGETHG